MEPVTDTTDEAWAENPAFRVLLNLDGGGSLEVGAFHSEAEAETCAQELAVRLAESTEWPRFGGRYLRPETIHAIEISERRRWGGSTARASAYSG